MFGFFDIGRLPNTKRLNLEAVGVELDEMGAVKEDEFSSTNIPSIWVVGDVTNRLNLTPVALMEGTCFSKTVFGGQPTKPDYSNVPCAVFCIPPLCVVGLSEEEAIEQAKGDVSIFTSTFNPMKNTVSGRQEKTVMKLVVDSEIDKVIGASMCGPDAPEIMQVAGKPGPTVKRISGLSILDNNGVNLVSILLTTVLDMLQMKKNAKAIAKHASNKNGPKTENDRPSSAIIYGSGMNIVFVGAEVGPWSKTGGLGDVLGGLPPAMAGNGHRVMTVSPRYDQYKDAWDTHVLQIKIGDRIETVRFFHCYKRGVDRVFVDHPMFLEKIISP